METETSSGETLFIFASWFPRKRYLSLKPTRKQKNQHDRQKPTL